MVLPDLPQRKLMASQKLTNCCVAAIALVTAAYLSTPQSSTIARLAFGVFCLAIHSFCFPSKALKLNATFFRSP
jgi:ABC-type transport system involved in multi-copper enzyme maturation permease subunit